MRDEDPAGMGFFVLCGRPWIHVSSHDWEMRLRPESFKGADVVVLTGCKPREGMTIQFPWEGSKVSTDVNIRYSLTDFLSYCGLRVHLNEMLIEAKDFLALRHGKPALRREYTDLGVEVSVFQSETYQSTDNVASFNFFGFTGSTKRPAIHSTQVCINILRAERIKPVLPARRDLVQNPDLDELRSRIELQCYQEIAMRNEHTLPYAQWERAHLLGVIMPEVERKLILFGGDRGEYSVPCLVPKDNFSYRLDCSLSSRALSRTLSHAINTNSDTPTLFRSRRKFEGYSWYDELPKVTAVRYFVNDVQLVEDAEDEDECAGGPVMTWDDDALPLRGKTELELVVANPDGTVFTVRLPATVLMQPDSDREWVDSISNWIISEDATTDDADDIADALASAWMPENWDSDDLTEEWGDRARGLVLSRISPAISMLHSVTTARNAADAALVLPDLPEFRIHNVRIELTKDFDSCNWHAEWESQGKDTGPGDYSLQLVRTTRDVCDIEIKGARNLADAIAKAKQQAADVPMDWLCHECRYHAIQQ